MIIVIPLCIVAGVVILVITGFRLAKQILAKRETIKGSSIAEWIVRNIVIPGTVVLGILGIILPVICMIIEISRK